MPVTSSSPDIERDAFIGVVASLAAAISLLERTPKAKSAAPSNTMFEMMLSDYRKALEAGRDALRASQPATPAGGEASDEFNQHIAWLKQYVEGMTAANWQDMRLRAERQLEQISKALDGRELGRSSAATAAPSDIEKAFQDACDEVGCEYDNEALLTAIARLKKHRDILARAAQLAHEETKQALAQAATPSEPVAWTNEAQLGYLKDEDCKDIPMAMWATPSGAADIPLYRNDAQCARESELVELLAACRRLDWASDPGMSMFCAKVDAALASSISSTEGK